MKDFVEKSLPTKKNTTNVVKVRSDKFMKLIELVLQQESPTIDFCDDQGRRVQFVGPKNPAAKAKTR